ncbi:MAG TPA: DUF885 domain-containing protein [Allosphingosinicella sp.]|jgi:uncharacterized protein (DUF885 family)|nr:DUF885 domain-containing protein [Allosphingosinicella sp.]
MDSDFSVSRRHFLGAGAAALLPAVGGPAVVAAGGLKALLDRASAGPTSADSLRILKTADAAAYGREDAAIVRMVVRGMEREEALRRAFPFGKADGASPYVVSQRHGAWMEADGKADPATISRRLDEETERLRAEAARGIVPPLFILDPVIEGERTRLSSPAGAALTRQIVVLESLRANAPREPGVWQLRGGADYYALRLQCTTGSDLSPAALDRLVNAEIGALTARADALLKRLGLAQGSVGARLRVLKQRPQYLYSNDEAGRARAVADMNAALARLRPHLPTWFNPPFEPGSSVKLMSAADEKAGKRGYRDAPTASAPGAYYPDVSDVHDRPAWTLTTVAYHETIPGHMIQLRRQEIAKPHPLQVRYAAGYSEGWAIYAESLADRMGILSPIDQVGFIQSWLFRLARIAADLGMHVRRWDRARALHYLEKTVGFELFFPFAVEVDRYAAEPAGFAGDGFAAISLRRMRPAAPAAVRAFHDRVLNRGPLSVEALREIV